MFKYLKSIHSGVKHKEKYASSNIIAKYLLNNFLGTIHTIVYLLKPRSVIEVGCGEGHILRVLYSPDFK